MILYLGTSSLVKLYAEEEYSGMVREWVREAEIVAKMAVHKMNSEAMKPERTIGAYTGSARWINSETCMPAIRTPEMKNMRGQSSFNISLMYSQYGK